MLVIDGALSDKVIFEHPRLRLLRIPERVQDRSVPPWGGASGGAHSSFATTQPVVRPERNGHRRAGHGRRYVKDADGNGVRVRTCGRPWQVQWISSRARLVSTNLRRQSRRYGPDVPI